MKKRRPKRRRRQRKRGGGGFFHDLFTAVLDHGLIKGAPGTETYKR